MTYYDNFLRALCSHQATLLHCSSCNSVYCTGCGEEWMGKQYSTATASSASHAVVNGTALHITSGNTSIHVHV